MTTDTTPAPVPERRIGIAESHGMLNVRDLAIACRLEGVPFATALALVEQESTNGANVWGRYDRSPFAGLDVTPTKATFEVYIHAVCNGVAPTGLGPCQITYAGILHTRSDGTQWRDGGYYRQMLEAGLDPWVPADNMRFGFRILRGHYDRVGDWRLALGHYNGGTTPNMTYATEVMLRRAEWIARFRASAS